MTILRFCFTAFAALTLALVQGGNVAAQSTVDLPAVTVTAEDADALTYSGLSNPVNSVSAHQIERTGARSLEDALISVPGIQARSRGGDDVRLSIRGSGLQGVVFTKARGVDLLIDGFPINGADGNFDYGLYSLAMAQSLDVYQGAAAAPLGSLTLGGAINLRTPTGRNVVDRVRLDGGSFGHVRGFLSGGFVNGDTDAAAQVEIRREDGFRDFSEGNAQKLAANLGHQFGGGIENRVYLNAARVKQNVSLPITQAELRADPEQGRVNGPPGTFNVNALTRPFYETHNLRVANRLSIGSGASALYEVEGHYMYRDIDFRRPSLPPTGFLLGPGWLTARTNDAGAQLRGTFKGSLAGRENELILGVRLAHQWGEEEIRPNLMRRKGDKFADGDLFASNYVLYAENAWRWTDTLTAVGGLRAFYADRDYDDNLRAGGTDLSENQDYSGIAPRVGLRWRAYPSMELFGYVSRNLEPPAFGDIIAIPVAPPPPQTISIQDLDLQKSWVVETGLNFGSDNLQWTTTLYYAWLEDEILRFAPDPGVATVGNQVGINADKTRHYGLELGFDWTLWRSASSAAGPGGKLGLAGQYTLRKHRFNDDATFGDNDLAGVPPQLVFVELLYESNSGWYTGLNVSGAPDSFPIDNANTFDVDHYLLLGAKAGWRGEQWSLYIEGRNLTDKAYAAAMQNAIDAGGVDQSLFFPGEGRAINVAMEWRW